MKSDRTYLLVAIVVMFLGAGIVLSAARPAFGDTTLYTTDFSSDPGWTTDQPANYYWDSATQTYFVRTENNTPAYHPNRYFYKLLSDGLASFNLAWDMKVTQDEWSSCVTFGVFDSNLTFGSPGSQSLSFILGRSDPGRFIGLYGTGASGVAYDEGPKNAWLVNTWYTCNLAYNTNTSTARLTVKQTGATALVCTVDLPVPGGFTNDLKYLGGSLNGVGDNGYAGINRWAVDKAYIDNVVVSQQTPPPPPKQKVYLAWGEDAPCHVLRIPNPFGRPLFLPISGLTTPAASTDEDTRNSVLSNVQQAFSNAGLTNIVVETKPSSPCDPATIVYFATAPYPTWELRGQAIDGVDRYNKRADGKVLIFDSSFSSAYMSNLVVHEVGHTLGLKHINPWFDTNSQNYPDGKDIMDYGWNWPEGFTNGVWHVYEPPDDASARQDTTHNPVYHLKRYVDGLSDDYLVSQGIEPGSWDTLSGSVALTTSLRMQPSDQLLYDVYVAAGFGADEMQVLAHFDVISLTDLAQQTFALDPGELLQLIASSAQGGGWDTVLATGDPYQEVNVLLEPIKGELQAFLQAKADTGPGYFTLADVTVASEFVPEPATLSLLALGGAALVARRKRRK